jgi:hypothetical protein
MNTTKDTGGRGVAVTTRSPMRKSVLKSPPQRGIGFIVLSESSLRLHTIRNPARMNMSTIEAGDDGTVKPPEGFHQSLVTSRPSRVTKNV